MDDRRFDELSRRLAAATTRRGGLKAALGALLGAAGVAAASGPAAAKGKRGGKRKRCRPACAVGQTCVEKACVCDNGGAVCGPLCCGTGEVCRDGRCGPEPEPVTCLALGEACLGSGRTCCAGLNCASGQAGEAGVGCYRPVGSACAASEECVYGTRCRDGACTLPDPGPNCTSDGGACELDRECCSGSICRRGACAARCNAAVDAGPDGAANGLALQQAVADAPSGATLYLPQGDYRFEQEQEFDPNVGGAGLLIQDKALTITRCYPEDVVRLECTRQLTTIDWACIEVYGKDAPTSLTLDGIELDDNNPKGYAALETDRSGSFPVELVLKETIVKNSNTSSAVNGLYGGGGTVTIRSGVTFVDRTTGAGNSYALQGSGASIVCEAAPNYEGTWTAKCNGTGITTQVCGC